MARKNAQSLLLPSVNVLEKIKTYKTPPVWLRPPTEDLSFAGQRRYSNTERFLYKTYYITSRSHLIRALSFLLVAAPYLNHPSMRLLPAFFVSLGVSLLSVAFASPVRPPTDTQMYSGNDRQGKWPPIPPIEESENIDVWFVPGAMLGYRASAIHGDPMTARRMQSRVQGFLMRKFGKSVSWQNGYSTELNLDHVRFRMKYDAEYTGFAIGIVDMGSGPGTATTDPVHGVYKSMISETGGDFEKLLETFRKEYPAATPANGV
ncbi:hypothetical protein F5876DRAFT_80309 [Lentinula aff. lateritia]|uniref:Uncharacterized protein n=1 Tax=Lentinula aff. lateritia TaxID=2804960 RepID=A0ACC1TQ38_9AGAR|nr:hypothetical protein F5876DRAFT_80309 [Lentinula aff. lateritia]